MIRFVVSLAILGLAAAEELKIETTFLPPSCTRKSAVGDRVSMHYTGTIDETSAKGKPGKEFDSSHARQKPFEFTLGQGRVIQGWEQGLLDMCIGEKRTLVVPPELGYGEKGSKGSIPGGATIRFEVECMNIRDGSTSKMSENKNVFKDIDKDGDWLITYDELMEFHIARFGNKPPPPGFWERFDKNKDGIVEWEEFSGPKGTEGPPKNPSKKEL